MTNQLAITDNSQLGIYRDPGAHMGAVEKMGAWIAESGMYGCKNVKQGCIIAFTCLATGISPIEFSQTYDIIDGKLAKKSARMLAEFRSKHGGSYKWIADGDDGKKATLALTFAGQTQEVSFRIEDAQRMKLADKDNWRRMPGEMLRSRVITKALRMVCPEIAAGIYSPEELGDMAPQKVEVTTAPANDSDALDFDEVTRLEALLEPFAMEADSLCRDKGWISPLSEDGQTFRDMPPKIARGILAAPEPLLAKLREAKADDAAQVIEANIVSGGVA